MIPQLTSKAEYIRERLPEEIRNRYSLELIVLILSGKAHFYQNPGAEPTAAISPENLFSALYTYINKELVWSGYEAIPEEEILKTIIGLEQKYDNRVISFDKIWYNSGNSDE